MWPSFLLALFTIGLAFWSTETRVSHYITIEDDDVFAPVTRGNVYNFSTIPLKPFSASVPECIHKAP